MYKINSFYAMIKTCYIDLLFFRLVVCSSALMDIAARPVFSAYMNFKDTGKLFLL